MFFFVLLYIPDRYVLHSMISDFELQRKLLEKFNLKNRRRVLYVWNCSSTVSNFLRPESYRSAVLFNYAFNFFFQV